MKVTKLGHCCLLIESRGVRVLTDPGNYTTSQNDVKNIDVVLISHEHTDHLHVDSLKIILKNNPKARVITNVSVGRILDSQGIKYEIVADGDKITDPILIEGIGKKHAVIYKEVEQVENTGYFIENRIFYPGDALTNPKCPTEILCVPVSGPWVKISESIDYALEVKPGAVIPVHDGNLVRIGLPHRLPSHMLPKHGIKFLPLELGKEYEF